jgi:putative ABC transport system permease protein
VGVVADIKVRGLDRTSEPQVYLPYQQMGDNVFLGYAPKDLAVRATASEATLVPAIRQIVRAADPEQPVSNVRMMAEIVAEQTASRAVQLLVIAALAAIAFLLTAVGIHGLLSYDVTSRAAEIGVRMALGAAAGDVVGMVVRRGLLLAVSGLVPGVVLAYLVGRGMGALLLDVRPGDPATFSAITVLSLTMAAVGCLVPALRAARVNPTSAMRTE